MQTDSSPCYLTDISATTHSSCKTLMGAILPCCRSCCLENGGQEDRQSIGGSYELQRPSNQLVVERVTNAINTESDEGQCCQPTPSRSSNSNSDDHHDDNDDNPPNNAPVWTQFWRRFTNRGRYQHIQSSDLDESAENSSNNGSNNNNTMDVFRNKLESVNPLRPASTFDSSSKEVLTIRTEEIVFPGSDLQKEMASKMLEALQLNDENNFNEEDECVICMEGFTKENPRMPTLCGCGENKTYFHLPCLYQWMEQSNECPSCSEEITWEEF